MSGPRNNKKNNTTGEMSEAKSPELPTTQPKLTNAKLISLIKNKVKVDIQPSAPALPSQPPSKKIIIVKQHEKFFKDLSDGMISLVSSYKQLHKNKLFPTRSGDLGKLSKIASDTSEAVMKEVKRLKNTHNESFIPEQYARGIAKLLLTLRQYLTKRIDSDHTLIQKLNQLDKQNDHHALRLVSLLFRNAFLSMASSSALDKNEMVHANYLAQNVLGPLNDEYVRANPSYQEVLGKIPVTLREKTALPPAVIQQVTPMQSYSHQEVIGKPSRANRNTKFSKQAAEGANVSSEVDQKVENKKTPKRE